MEMIFGLFYFFDSWLKFLPARFVLVLKYFEFFYDLSQIYERKSSPL